MSGPDLSKLDDFTRGYIEAALWASELDELGPGALSRETWNAMLLDCARFQAENYIPVPLRLPPDCTAAALAGHDFWLTRNGHGAGFWDGDWPREFGERLTRAAKAFGECNLYVTICHEGGR